MLLPPLYVPCARPPHVHGLVWHCSCTSLYGTLSQHLCTVPGLQPVKNFDPAERRYNNAQSSTRMSAERGNGRLLKLFGILRSPIRYDADTATLIVGVCCGSANYIQDHCPVVDEALDRTDGNAQQRVHSGGTGGDGAVHEDALAPVSAQLTRRFLQQWCLSAWGAMHDD